MKEFSINFNEENAFGVDKNYDYTYELNEVKSSDYLKDTTIHRTKVLITDNNSGLKYDGYFKIYDGRNKSCDFNILPQEDLTVETEPNYENALFAAESAIHIIEDQLLNCIKCEVALELECER